MSQVMRVSNFLKSWEGSQNATGGIKISVHTCQVTKNLFLSRNLKTLITVTETAHVRKLARMWWWLTKMSLPGNVKLKNHSYITHLGGENKPFIRQRTLQILQTEVIEFSIVYRDTDVTLLGPIELSLKVKTPLLHMEDFQHVQQEIR